MNRLVLIDGNAILHRAYHALPPLTNRSGQVVNAVYGFASMLLKIISDLRPAYLVAVFDAPGPSFRKQEYIGYQAKRKEMAVELKSQVELVQEMVQAFGIRTFIEPNYEADDVIGTLAKWATESERGVDEVVIVTGDQDLMQLVGEKIKLYMPTRGLSDAQVVGAAEVKAKLGVPPDKVVDYKGLVGDSSDNYPGVIGIGPKTAVDLLQRYGSFAGIYRWDKRLAKEIGRSVQAKLAKGREGGELSRKLAQIVTDVPVNLELTQAKTPDPQNEAVLAFFREMGFRSLLARVTPSGQVKEVKKKNNEQPTLF